MDRRSRELVSGSVTKIWRGRCVLQVGVNVVPRLWLKKIERTTYITEGVPSFLESPLLRTLQLSMLAMDKSYGG